MAWSTRQNGSVRSFIFGLACFALLASGCQQSDSPANSPANAPANAPASGESPRIISLSPAISRTLVDLELAEFVVGRTPWCTAIDESVPVVGDLLSIDYERLVRLKPTHVLLQPQAGGVQPRLQDLADEQGWRLGQWMLNDRRDIERMILEMPAVLGESDERYETLVNRGTQLVAVIDAAMSANAADAEDLWRGRVLLVASADPVMVYGQGTYVSDLLIALGSENAAPVEGWRQLSLEDVTRLDPEAVILVSTGDAELSWGVLGDLQIAANRDGRTATLVHPDALLPSSGIIGVCDELRRVLRSLNEPRP